MNETTIRTIESIIDILEDQLQNNNEFGVVDAVKEVIPTLKEITGTTCEDEGCPYYGTKHGHSKGVDYMNVVLQNIIKSRCGGRVERCHTIPHHGSYNNAAHSWGVAMLMYYLFPEDYPRLSIYCLTHDIGEGWMGDIPAPAKWALGEIGVTLEKVENDLIEAAGCPREDSLGEEDLAKLKACDRLELYLWCQEQFAMGNLNVIDCGKALEVYFEQGNLHERAIPLFERIRDTHQYDLLAKQQGIVQGMVDGR